uniref:SCP domain-containing protein n=1 Tax=Alexandrium monilatum TaxID=311494 RepID=A0A7S4W8U8_9DINO
MADVAAALPAAAGETPRGPDDLQGISLEAFRLTNAYRCSLGLRPCRWHGGLARIALERASRMASGAASFSHAGLAAHSSQLPIVHCGVAENLCHCWSEDVARYAVEGWIGSPDHERNLRGRFGLCGVGTACSPQGTFYLVQLFAAAPTVLAAVLAAIAASAVLAALAALAMQ